MSIHPKTRRHLPAPEGTHAGSGWALGLLGVICLGSWLSASADDGWTTSVALLAAGLLMVWQPVRQQLPVGCWIAGGLWASGGLLAFLAADPSVWPDWRVTLALAGIDTGWRHTPQPAAALGSFAVAAATGLVALWAACQPGGRRRALTIGFVAAVCGYALFAWLGPDLLNFKANAIAHFGFYPNRNHSATLLVMGCMAALGLLAQGIRWRSGWQIGAATAALILLVGVQFSLSASRAGILLLGVGTLLWLLLAGRRYLSGHASKAVALVIGGFVLILPMLDTPVRERLEQALEQVSAAPEDADPVAWSERAASFDGRVPLHRDTITMIAAAPLQGWGAGQFEFVFPQYRDWSNQLSEKVCLHPESDWLWIAAEYGVPAALGLAIGLLALVIPAVRSIRSGRARALRAGLLVAALVLPLHGLLDVPGHKTGLLWAAAGLLALASGERPTAKYPRLAMIGWRLAGAAVAVLGACLLYGNATGKPLPATDRTEHLLAAARSMYRQEIQRTQAEPDVMPDPADDPLETAIEMLRHAAVLTPLDPRVHGFTGMLALHFDDKDDLARESFRNQLALDPARVSLPLALADAWSKIDPLESREHWIEAMRRAGRLEQQFPDGRWEETTTQRILRDARGSEELRQAASEALATPASATETDR
jgi:hypothetical protein